MNALLRIATVFAAGAAAMYYLDPETGRRRRALVRDRSGSAARGLRDAARNTGRDLSNRMQGTLAETTSHIAAEPVDDATLHARIRAKLGHLMDRPSDVDVQVQAGHVVLGGAAPDDEAAALARYVAGMQGVVDVKNRLAADGGPGHGSAAH